MLRLAVVSVKLIGPPYVLIVSPVALTALRVIWKSDPAVLGLDIFSISKWSRDCILGVMVIFDVSFKVPPSIVAVRVTLASLVIADDAVKSATLPLVEMDPRLDEDSDQEKD
jgi:hypothetical protein